MARRTLVVLAVLAILTLPALPAAAGGCGSAATQGTGDTVEMVQACFTPSILRITPGETVTFVNRDGFSHNVSATGWGNFEDMGMGDAFTATFADEGVYPFACTYHPGMTGAIVVGDGDGPGNGAVVAGTSDRDPGSTGLEVAAGVEESSGLPSGLGWLAGGAIGLALGLAIGLGAPMVVRRRAVAA